MYIYLKMVNNRNKGCVIMVILQKIALVITIIGAVNWGLIGLFDFNVITYLFGTDSAIPRIIYTIVGITGLINIGILFDHIEK